MASPIPVGAFHVSRATLAATLDFQEVARNNTQMDAALAQATALTEAFLHRGFFPWSGTRTFDWPTRDNPVSWRLRLNDNELISLTSASSGGTALTPASLLLYPQTGPPYTYIETSLSANDVFQAGNSWQNAVSITGFWGYSRATRAVATLGATITGSQTTLTVSDSSQLGAGHVILLDNEYMVVRGLTSLTTTQTLQTPLAASAAGTAVVVTNGAAYAIGETILLDAEQMLIVDIASNTLVVKRARNGTVLATHTGSTVFSPRTLTVDRAACGTTAATHTIGASVALHVVPYATQALTLAEASWIYLQGAQGWMMASNNSDRNVGSLGILDDLRRQAQRAVGRKMRQRAV